MVMQKLVLALTLAVVLYSCDRVGKKAGPGFSEMEGYNTGMLILGSHDKNTLEQRVKLGYELYQSTVSFDYIIVSGGCGAHGSDICEAAEMAGILEDMGIPARKIYKEEKATSTVQNYCFSRVLRKEDGTKLISPGDSLYVVSSHWHAIPVAARFKTYDRVNAIYYIKGNILPLRTDKVDYTNIYDNELSSEDFCK